MHHFNGRNEYEETFVADGAQWLMAILIVSKNDALKISL
jgi:hypothetical protein